MAMYKAKHWRFANILLRFSLFIESQRIPKPGQQRRGGSCRLLLSHFCLWG